MNWGVGTQFSPQQLSCLTVLLPTCCFLRSPPSNPHLRACLQGSWSQHRQAPGALARFEVKHHSRVFHSPSSDRVGTPGGSQPFEKDQEFGLKMLSPWPLFLRTYYETQGDGSLCQSSFCSLFGGFEGSVSSNNMEAGVCCLQFSVTLDVPLVTAHRPPHLLLLLNTKLSHVFLLLPGTVSLSHHPFTSSHGSFKSQLKCHFLFKVPNLVQSERFRDLCGSQQSGQAGGLALRAAMLPPDGSWERSQCGDEQTTEVERSPALGTRLNSWITLCQALPGP